MSKSAEEMVPLAAALSTSTAGVVRGLEPSGSACACGAGLSVWQFRTRKLCDVCFEATLRREEEQQRLSVFARVSQVDAAYSDMRLETFLPRTDADASALADVSSWNGEHSLILTGPNGSGKTHLAVGALFREYRRGRSVAYIPGRSMPFRMRLLDSENRTKYDLWNRLEAVEVLLLDDFAPPAGERAEKWADEAIPTLLDERFRARRPTIVTTNRSPKMLYHGERNAAGATVTQGDPKTWSRLLERATIVLVNPGSDRRLKPIANGGE